MNYICKNCGNIYTGKYCNSCGEKRVNIDNRSFSHLLSEGFHFITHFEGKFFTTFKTVILQPGKLSLDYCNGIRHKYFKPLSFFLFLVILYLVFPIFEGLNMHLRFHTQHEMYGQFASGVVEDLMAKTGLTFDQLADKFHQKGAKASKFLLFLIIPALAFISWLMAFRRRKFYYDHFIFTTEATSFFILWGFLAFPFLLLLSTKMGLPPDLLREGNVAVIIFSVFLIFLFFAAKRFFSFHWWMSIIYSVVFMIGLAFFINYIYKFILFFLASKMV